MTVAAGTLLGSVVGPVTRDIFSPEMEEGDLHKMRFEKDSVVTVEAGFELVVLDALGNSFVICTGA